MNNATSADTILVDVVGFYIVSDYTLRVKFSDHSSRVIDFEPILLGPLFGPLRKLDLFNQVSLDSNIGTLTWPNGADIDPTVLHDWPDHIDAIVARRKRYAHSTMIAD